VEAVLSGTRESSWDAVKKDAVKKDAVKRGAVKKDAVDKDEVKKGAALHTDSSRNARKLLSFVDPGVLE